MFQKFLILIISYFLIVSSFAASTREIGFDVGMLKTQATTPASPGTGKNKIYVKDGNLKLLDSTGSEKNIGSAESDNFMTDPGAELVNTSCVTYADSAALPIDGTGGAPSVSVANSTSSPLSGLRSLVFTKTASNTQGQGFSCDFTIDNASKGKVLRTQFDYEIASGAYSSGDVKIWIYDITNSRLIEPSSYSIENSGLKETKFSEWQSSIDSTSYRLIFHVTSTSTNAYTLKFDSFKVGRGPKVYGSVTTDWIPYTPTFTGFGTPTNVDFKYRKDGSDIEIQGYFISGVSTGVEARVSLPSGLSTSSSVQSSPKNHWGEYAREIGGSTTQHGGVVFPVASQNYFVFGAVETYSGSNINNSLTSRNGDLIVASGTIVSLKIRVPIAGWSSSQQLSQDADTRVVSARAYRSGDVSTSTGVETKIALNASTFDDVGGFDLVNNRYVAKVAGKYRASGSIGWDSNGTGVRGIGLRKNGTEFARAQVQPSGTSATITSTSDVVSINVGDYIELYGVQTSGGSLNVFGFPSYTFLSLEKISGPAQIASSESVIARYTQSSGQSIPNSTRTIVDFNIKDYDSHNAVTTGASWKFTAPISGTYRISANVLFTNVAWTAGSATFSDLYKNGATYASSNDRVVQAAFNNHYGPDPLNVTVRLLAGEYIDFRIFQNRGSATTMYTSSNFNYISIERVGNY